MLSPYKLKSRTKHRHPFRRVQLHHRRQTSNLASHIAVPSSSTYKNKPGNRSSLNERNAYFTTTARDLTPDSPDDLNRSFLEMDSDDWSVVEPSDGDYSNQVVYDQYDEWLIKKVEPIFTSLFFSNLLQHNVASSSSPIHTMDRTELKSTVLKTLLKHNIITSQTDHKNIKLPKSELKLRQIKQPKINDVFNKLQQYNIIPKDQSCQFSPGFCTVALTGDTITLNNGDQTRTISDVIYDCMVLAGGKDLINGHYKIMLDNIPKYQTAKSDFNNTAVPLDTTTFINSSIQNISDLFFAQFQYPIDVLQRPATTPTDVFKLIKLYNTYHRHDIRALFQQQDAETYHQLRNFIAVTYSSNCQALDMLSNNDSTNAEHITTASNILSPLFSTPKLLKMLQDIVIKQCLQYLFDKLYLSTTPIATNDEPNFVKNLNTTNYHSIALNDCIIQSYHPVTTDYSVNNCISAEHFIDLFDKVQDNTIEFKMMQRNLIDHYTTAIPIDISDNPSHNLPVLLSDHDIREYVQTTKNQQPQNKRKQAHSFPYYIPYICNRYHDKSDSNYAANETNDVPDVHFIQSQESAHHMSIVFLVEKGIKNYKFYTNALRTTPLTAINYIKSTTESNTTLNKPSSVLSSPSTSLNELRKDLSAHFRNDIMFKFAHDYPQVFELVCIDASFHDKNVYHPQYTALTQVKQITLTYIALMKSQNDYDVFFLNNLNNCKNIQRSQDENDYNTNDNDSRYMLDYHHVLLNSPQQNRELVQVLS